MEEKMKLYEAVRSVPANAQKSIAGGRLKGMTDINPMWRIKTLTEQFGMCGVGWKYEVKSKDMHKNDVTNEVAVFVDILLYVKVDGAWSDGISGSGGSMFVSSERNGLYTDDECFKKATTDAIGSACKLLGVGADVYWEKDTTKYDKKESDVKELTAGEKASAIAEMSASKSMDEVTKCWHKYPSIQTDKDFYKACVDIQVELNKGK